MSEVTRVGTLDARGMSKVAVEAILEAWGTLKVTAEGMLKTVAVTIIGML